MVTRSLFLAIGLGMGVLAALGCERVDGSSLTTDPIVNDSAGSSPSLSVQGPDVINTKGTFQYTASPLHFGGTPSVLWSERFCNDTTGKGCSAWTGDSGPAATYDRVLGPDCSSVRSSSPRDTPPTRRAARR